MHTVLEGTGEEERQDCTEDIHSFQHVRDEKHYSELDVMLLLGSRIHKFYEHRGIAAISISKSKAAIWDITYIPRPKYHHPNRNGLIGELSNGFDDLICSAQTQGRGEGVDLKFPRCASISSFKGSAKKTARSIPCLTLNISLLLCSTCRHIH